MRTCGNSPRPSDPSDIPPSTTSPTRQNRTTRATPPNSRCHSSPAHLPRGARRARPVRPDKPSRESTQRARPTRGTRQSRTIAHYPYPCAHTDRVAPYAPDGETGPLAISARAPHLPVPSARPDASDLGPPGAHPAMPDPPDSRQQHFRPSTPHPTSSRRSDRLGAARHTDPIR